MKALLSVLLCLSALLIAPAAPAQEAPATQTVSVDFPNEERAVILRNVADIFELDLRLPASLRGSVSLKARNRGWRFFFDEVLQPVGYAWKEENGVIVVYDAFPERSTLVPAAATTPPVGDPGPAAGRTPFGAATWVFLALTGAAGIAAVLALRPGVVTRAKADPRWSDSVAQLAALIRVLALFIAFEAVVAVGGMAMYSAAFHGRPLAPASAFVAAGLATSSCTILLFLATSLLTWRIAPWLALRLSETLRGTPPAPVAPPR